MQAVALDANKVLLFGGRISSGTASVGTTYMFDFSANVWSIKATMNTARDIFGGGVIAKSGECVSLDTGSFFPGTFVHSFWFSGF
jgi:hypothetical protein